MKRLIFLAVACFVLGGCGGEDKTKDSSKPIGMPNPASEFCVQQGGESIAKTHENGGTYRVCKLKDGGEINEWTYFKYGAGR